MKHLLFSVSLILVLISANGQDIIYKTNGDSISCEVLEIGDDFLRYRFTDTNFLRKSTSIDISKISRIVYQNGYTDSFHQNIVEGQYNYDLILMRNGDEVKARVEEIGEAYIKYRKFDLPNSPMFTVSINDVVSIRFRNGYLEEIKEKWKAGLLTGDPDKDYQLGFEDAVIFYNSSNTFWVMFGVSLVYPISGIIASFFVASSPPKDKNLDVPEPDYEVNEQYMNGYRKQAHKMKKKATFSGMGAGVIVSAGTVAIIFSLDWW